MRLPTTAEQSSKPRDGEWRTYRLYGLTLASDFAFANSLAPATGAPDLTFACTPSAPLPGSLEQRELVYASPPYPEGGESEVLLYRLGACWVVRFTGVTDFYLWPDRILCHLQDPKYPALSRNPKYHHMVVEVQLLGMVLACWLEWQGIPALHASAVVVEDSAVAFLSTGGGGKSSSAVALMQAGHPLLADDIVPVERSGGAFIGRPGYPQMRMWPEQAEYFLGHYEDLEIVYPGYSKRRVPVEENGLGSFCGVSRPLACLYLPERRNPIDWGTRIEIMPVQRRGAVMALIGHSFVPHIVEAMGLHPRRLSLFAEIAMQVPMRRVVYPNGFDHLPRVRHAILNDLAGLSSSQV
jgi:hypothetical protein